MIAFYYWLLTRESEGGDVLNGNENKSKQAFEEKRFECLIFFVMP